MWQPLVLVLLDLEALMPILRGVVMELTDCSLPLLRGAANNVAYFLLTSYIFGHHIDALSWHSKFTLQQHILLFSNLDCFGFFGVYCGRLWQLLIDTLILNTELCNKIATANRSHASIRVTIFWSGRGSPGRNILVKISSLTWFGCCVIPHGRIGFQKIGDDGPPPRRAWLTPVAYLGFHKGGSNPPLPSLPPAPSLLPSLAPTHFPSQASPSLPSPLLRSRPPYIQLGGLGERCKLPQRGPGRSRSRNRFWCILALKSGIWWQQF